MSFSPRRGEGATEAVGSGLRWRAEVDGPLGAAHNMARDHAHALALRQGNGVLRFYRWSSPTLSLGRNEPARHRFDPERLAAAGVDVVRRPTGGRAVLHHRELTYCVCLPMRALGGARAAYQRINRGLVAGLAEVGAAVELSGPGSATLPLDAGPCFRAPAPGEVTAAGRKLVGSAQARIGEALLQHGSLLLHDDQALLHELEGVALEGGTGAVALEELVTPLPSLDVLTSALTGGLARELGGDWTAAGDRPTLTPTTAAPQADEVTWIAHYRDPSWTWRR